MIYQQIRQRYIYIYIYIYITGVDEGAGNEYKLYVKTSTCINIQFT